MRHEHAAQITMGFPMPEGAAPLPLAWVPVSQLMGRNNAWRAGHFPGVTVRHCGHPTALRPYYIVGLPIDEKFHSLSAAQRAVERHRGAP